MQILLVQPPMKDYAAIRAEKKIERHFKTSSEPLGLEYIASFLTTNSKLDINIEIFDFDILRFSFEEIAAFLSKKKPDIVGLSCNFAPTTPYTLETARIVKEQTNALCVVGGVQATYIIEEILNSGNVDLVVMYEGEKTFLDIVTRFNSNKIFETKGIAYKIGKKIIKNQPNEIIKDLDRLPFPARDLLPIRKYLDKFGLLYVASSRGCPYDCIYCACSAFSECTFRARTAKNILDEITYLHDTHSVHHISFTDDLFTLDNRRVQEFCEKLIDKQIDITWDCHSRVDTVTESLMKKMKDAGCIRIKFGIESGSQHMLDYSRRKYTLEKVRDIVTDANRIGFEEVRCCFMFGMPGETYETVEKTIKFALELEPDCVEFLITMPFPGTELFKIMQNDNMILTTDWKVYRHGHIAINPLFCTPQELIHIQRDAYERYYFRKKYFDTQLKRSKEVKDIIRFLSSWWFEIQQIGRTDIEG